MSGQQFCNVENRPFDDREFASGPDGLTIHVLTSVGGHTLDGWPATFKAHRDEGRWVVEHVKIEEPTIHQYPEIVAR